jgi:hypothetical protein
MMKVCTACRVEKPRTAFRKRNDRAADSVRSKCAECEDRIRRDDLSVSAMNLTDLPAETLQALPHAAPYYIGAGWE